MCELSLLFFCFFPVRILPGKKEGGGEKKMLLRRRKETDNNITVHHKKAIAQQEIVQGEKAADEICFGFPEEEGCFL